jgi:hypothetical protein
MQDHPVPSHSKEGEPIDLNELLAWWWVAEIVEYAGRKNDFEAPLREIECPSLERLPRHWWNNEGRLEHIKTGNVYYDWHVRLKTAAEFRHDQALDAPTANRETPRRRKGDTDHARAELLCKAARPHLPESLRWQPDTVLTAARNIEEIKNNRLLNTSRSRLSAAWLLAKKKLATSPKA